MNRKDFARKHALVLATIGFAPLAAWSNLCLPAKGADIQQPVPAPAPTYDMVDFASGWYVRGDVAYAQETFPKITPDFAVGGTPSVVNAYSVGAGMGYKVNDWFRTDLVFDYRDRVRSAGFGAPGPCALATFISSFATSTSGTCFFDTTIQRFDLLANGYLDLGTWQGFTPYIGAGAGVDWARIRQSVDPVTLSGLPPIITASNTRYHFAWAAMAGVAFAVTDHVQLDVGYRFLDLGLISGISSVTGIPVTKDIFANEIRGGLRYMID